MSSNINSFKVHPPLDLNVSDFFKKTELVSWSLENFYNYVKERDPKIELQRAKEMFEADVDRLKTFKHFQNPVKSRIGLIKNTQYVPNNDSGVTKVTYNNHGIMISGSKNCSISNCTVNNVQSVNEKKRKIRHTDEEESWKIENDDDFWSAWKEYLDLCNSHEFCLEKYHIIECGYSIKCKPNYPEELYDNLGDNTQQTIKSPFKTYPEYTKKIIQALNSNNERLVLKEMLSDQHWNLIDQGSPTAKFVYDFFYDIHHYFKKLPSLSTSESMFNHQLVWPLMELVVRAIDTNESVKFFSGEKILNASEEDYNSDAIIKSDGIEICLLETSGQFKLNDTGRFGYDHVKGAFGALSLLRKIVKTWFYAKEESLQELKIFFIHARKTKIHLWSLEMTSHDVQVLERVASTDIPTKTIEPKNILDLGNFAWKFKKCLETTCEIIKKMKEEHEEYLLSLQVDDETERRMNLAIYVEKEVQKPVRGSKYGLLLPEELDDCDVEIAIIKER